MHRIGRTGRAGKTGIAISLYSPSEKRNLRQVEYLTRQKFTPTPVPTEEEIRSHREGRLLRQMTIWLGRGRFKREREIVENLVQEGYDPLEIAAAAMKIARADEKQRPIAPVSEVLETRPERFARADRPRRLSERSSERSSAARLVSHEDGMVRLSLNMGRKHGIHPNDIVGAIAAHARIPGSSIGKIHIQDEHALVDVPAELVDQVLVNPRPMHIRKQRVDLQIA